MILDRLNFIENKYDELSVKISAPYKAFSTLFG